MYTTTLQDAQLPTLEYPNGTPSGSTNSGIWPAILTSVTSIVASIFGRGNTQQTTTPVYYQAPTTQTGINTTTIIIVAAALLVFFMMREPSGRRR